MINTEYIDVSENIVLMRITGTGHNEGNVTCIELDDRLVFVDAGRVAKPIKEFRSKMEERFDKVTSLLLLTHTHGDHYFGIDAFSDVPIITTSKGVESIAENMKTEWSQEGRQKTIEEVKGFFKEQGKPIPEKYKKWQKDLLEAEIHPPTIGVKDEISIESNGGQIHYRSIGGHSECSAYLFCESENILITGDNLVAEHGSNSACMLAGLGADGVDILQSFEGMNVDKLIPGHGPVVNTDYVRTSREWFTNMFEKLRVLKKKGLSKEEAIADSSLPEFFEEKKPGQWENILGFWYDKL